MGDWKRTVIAVEKHRHQRMRIMAASVDMKLGKFADLLIDEAWRLYQAKQLPKEIERYAREEDCKKANL